MKVTEITRKTFLATLAKRPVLNQGSPYIWLGKRGPHQKTKCLFKQGIHVREVEAATLGIPPDALDPQFLGLFQDRRGKTFVAFCAYFKPSPPTSTPPRFFKIQLQ